MIHGQGCFMYARMRNLKSKISSMLLAAFFAVCLLPAMAVAQDGSGSGKSSGGEEDHAVGLVKLVQGAVKGEPEAIEVLVQQKIVPAIVVLAALVLTWTVASSIGRYFGGMVSKKVDLTLGKFLTKAIRNLLMVIVAIGVLGYFEVDVTGFAAVLAALGFAIGMALQGTLGNFASGVMLLLFRPFKVEDFIVVADTRGTVEEIDLFTTRINTPDNRHIIIPNSEIFGSKLENYSRNELRRVDVAVGAAYSADLEFTRAALERAVRLTDCASEPAGYVYLKELGASSVDWELRAWCKPAEYWAIREQLVTNFPFVDLFVCLLRFNAI